jgi:2-polyprenyl-6-hydroxyphenyl methylase/3-demethylubiquinone-9 3-methyltransferase
MNSNFKQTELDNFGALAKQWWDPKGPMRALHQLNPLRLAFIQRHMVLNDQAILDVGCGAGLLSEALAEQGAKTTAIDLSPEVITVAKQHAQTNHLSIDYQVIAVETLATNHPHSFSAISCMEMLEHVPDPAAILKACADLLKPQGLLFLSTLNRTLKSYLLAIAAAEYILNYLPKGTHEYSQFIKPAELAHWADAAGLEMVDMQGISYHPLANEFRFSHKVDVNYLMAFRRP